MYPDRLLKQIWNRTPQRLRSLYLKMRMYRKFGKFERLPRSGPLYIAGAFRSGSGMGMGARLYAHEMDLAASPHYCIDLTSEMHMNCELPPRSNMLHCSDLTGKRGGVLVLHANPPQFQLALLALPKSFLNTVHIRAYWAWELEIIPPVWLQALPWLDSLECPSHFCRQAFARYINVPITVHAHAVPDNVKKKTEYCADGLLRCLCIFDAGSSFERKNPQAVLEAFSRAFKAGEAELTFKISHAEADLPAYRQFLENCARVPGVRVVEDLKKDEELSNLYLENDVLISLHRSEGYGLCIKEALRHGLHVLATGWSGNMDFMQGDLCHVVPFKLVGKQWRRGPMKGLKGRWAEADVAACADILRRLRKSLSHKAHQKNKGRPVLEP